MDEQFKLGHYPDFGLRLLQEVCNAAGSLEVVLCVQQRTILAEAIPRVALRVSITRRACSTTFS